MKNVICLVEIAAICSSPGERKLTLLDDGKLADLSIRGQYSWLMERLLRSFRSDCFGFPYMCGSAMELQVFSACFLPHVSATCLSMEEERFLSSSLYDT